MHYSILEKAKKTVSFLTLITFLITNISYASIDSNRNPKDTTLRVSLTFSSPEFDAFLGKAAENAETKDGIDISHADSQVRIQQTIVIAAVREWRRQRETTAAIEENLRQAFPQLNLYEIVRVDNRGTFHTRLGDRYVKITTKGIEESSAATFTLISSSIGKLKPDRGKGSPLSLLHLLISLRGQGITEVKRSELISTYRMTFSPRTVDREINSLFLLGVITRKRGVVRFAPQYQNITSADANRMNETTKEESMHFLVEVGKIPRSIINSL